MRELLFGLLLLGGTSEPATHKGIGRAATYHELRTRDITVLPSGQGLPAGSGTAREGKVLYQAHCASCHGARGEGQGDYPPLAGGRRSGASDELKLTVGSYWPYATTVWDYIRRAMPYDHPGILSPDRVYAITAFVLSLDDIVREDEVIDQRSLPKVAMPNREGFVPDPREKGRQPASSPSPPTR